MADGPRRRFDLLRLPVALRYALALTVVALVVAVVVAVKPPGQQPVGWYTPLVTVGAVGLLLVGSVRVLVRLRRWMRRRRATSPGR